MRAPSFPSLPADGWQLVLPHFQRMDELFALSMHCVDASLAQYLLCPAQGNGWKREMFLLQEQILQLCRDKSQKCFLLSQVPTWLGNYREIIQGCSPPEGLKTRSSVCDAAHSCDRQDLAAEIQTAACLNRVERESGHNFQSQIIIIYKSGCLALGCCL